MTEPFITRQRPVHVVYSQNAAVKQGMTGNAGNDALKPAETDSEKQTEQKVLNKIPGLEVDKGKT